MGPLWSLQRFRQPGTSSNQGIRCSSSSRKRRMVTVILPANAPVLSRRSSGRSAGNTIASRAGSIGTLVGFIRASNESNFL